MAQLNNMVFESNSHTYIIWADPNSSLYGFMESKPFELLTMALSYAMVLMHVLYIVKPIRVQKKITALYSISTV